MDTFRRLIAQINEQLTLLSTSQKLAVGLCAVIVAGSMAWLLSHSTSPERVALLSQDLALGELDAAEDALHAAGVSFETRGNRIFVNPGEQPNAIRILNRADALPQDTTIGFAKLIEEDSPFRSESENAFRRRVALGNELAKVIASSPDVATARVFINMESKRGFGIEKSRPSASVYVTMARGRQINQGMVESFARLTAGAVRGLLPHDMNIIDAVALTSFKMPNPEDVWASDMLDRKKKEEGHLLAKILNQLTYIPGVLAGVTVELDPAKTQTKTTAWAPVQPKIEESRTEKTTSGQGSGETGTNPNVGVALANAGGSTGSETEDTKTENFNPNPTEVKVEDKVPFGIKRVTASVNIPRSFLVSVFKAQPGNKDKDPADTDQVFMAVRSGEEEKVRRIVKNVVMAQTDDDVKVETYHDFEPGTATLRGIPGGMLAQAGAVETESKIDMIRTYAPEAGLSVLAVFSLLMVFMMVRKSARAAAAIPMPSMPEPEDNDLITTLDGTLAVPGGPVGRADSAEGVLHGQEVDENTLRFKELGDQISRMVDDNPDIAADLLRRWVEASE